MRYSYLQSLTQCITLYSLQFSDGLLQETKCVSLVGGNLLLSGTVCMYESIPPETNHEEAYKFDSMRGIIPDQSKLTSLYGGGGASWRARRTCALDCP